MTSIAAQGCFLIREPQFMKQQIYARDAFGVVEINGSIGYVGNLISQPDS